MQAVNIFGIDASAVFVKVLGESLAYSGSQLIWMGRGTESFPDQLKNKFDIVTACGVFLRGHIPASCMDDIHASLKPNGYFVTAMRTIYYEHGAKEGYREKLDELVDANKFRLVRTEVFYRGIEGKEGLFGRQESRLLCYQKCGD